MSCLESPLKLRLLLVVASLTLALGACGSDSGNSGPDDVTDEVDAGGDVGQDPVDDPGAPDLGNDTGDDPAVETGDDPDLNDTGTPDIPIEDGGTDDTGEEEDGIQVVAINPSRGPDLGGTEVLVIGLGFTFDTDVFLGGILCENIDVVDETKIICDTPPNPAGIYDVKVFSEEGSDSLSDAYTYFAPVELDSIDPTRGPTGGGMPAEITGAGFGPDTQVSIGGRVALGIEVIDSETVRFLVPPGNAGLATVRVSGLNGLAQVEDGFEYYTPIRVDRILPGSGPADGGTEVIIEGAGFTDIDGESDVSVTFGLLEADVDVVDSGELRVTAPPGPADSAVDVTVQSQLNGAFTAVGGYYYYESVSGLALHNAAPARGSTAGGDEIVLSGNGLDAVTQVTFGASTATIVESDSAYLIVDTPPGSAGSVDVTVTDPSDSATLVDGFTYLTGVRIDSIDPTTGDAAGGEAVTVEGAGFEAGTRLRIGALSAVDVEVVDSGTLNAVTPPGAVGLSDVTVTAPTGLSDTLEDGFTYTADLLLNGFSPTKGAMAGGTYVVLRGAGFVEPLTVTFGGVESEDVTVLDSATVAVYSPPNGAGFVDVSVQVGDGDPVEGPERFLYFDPTLNSGGHYGDSIDGSVNVTVLSFQGSPLPQSFVMLSVREDAEFFGYTDANGQVTLSGPGIFGAQTVTASRVGFGSSTVEAVNAENITVMLGCVPENQCSSTADCREGFVCTCGPPFSGGFPGICLVDPYCGFEPQSQEEFDAACTQQFQTLPFGVVTGNLTGVEKVDDPGANERVLGQVFTTQPHPFQSSPIDPGTGNARSDDGPYTLRARTGEIAIVAVCGLFNDLTQEFSPRYMGVARGLFISDGETYNVDIDCNIKLDQVISVKVPNSPFASGGPNEYIHIPYLHFGAEGYFGGIVQLEGTTDVLSATGFAPLEGELAGLSYYIIGGAHTDGWWPESQAVLENISNVNELITLPEFVPPVDMVQPNLASTPYCNFPATGTLQGRYLEWQLATDVAPDFYYITITDCNGTPYWDVLAPGDQTSVNLPYFPPDAEVGLFSTGALAMQIFAVDAKQFDYNNFDNYNNFVLNNWQSWSFNNFVFSNPDVN